MRCHVKFGSSPTKAIRINREELQKLQSAFLNFQILEDGQRGSLDPPGKLTMFQYKPGLR